MAAAVGGADQRDLLSDLYPGRLALLLVPLCVPTPHAHKGVACQHPGKVPLEPGWNGDATARFNAGTGREAHLDRIAKHLAAGRNVGWAVPEGVLVLDGDRPASTAFLASVLEDAPAQQSRAGRGHFVVRAPVGLALKAKARVELKPGIEVDLRVEGKSQIVVEPSVHATGAAYTWLRSLPEDLGKLPALPHALEESLRRDAQERREPSAPPPGGSAIAEGRRNDTLVSLAGAMRHKGATAEAILAAIRAENVLCAPPLPDAELQAIARSVGRYAPGGESLTDLGNAERLVRLYGENLRYVHPWRRWLAWDGRRWAIDTSGEASRRAKATVRAIHGEAAQTKDDDVRKAIAAWARKSEGKERIAGLLTLAQCELPLDRDHLDASPFLLNVQNGCLDLRSGKLRGHERRDFHSKLAPVDYDPEAEAPTWRAFLERVFPDPEVRDFVQRATGYSLTADVGEQVLFLLFGSGANGKTTFVEAIMGLLGDYAIKTPAETFLTRRSDIPNDVAALRGARFAAAVESEEDRRLAESRVKELTGGDTVSARFMRAEWFNFRPVAKLWLATNHKPAVRGTDEGIWRRIRLIPFTVTIPERERDPDLPARLREESAGILAWAVQGCLAWQRKGLAAPAAVRGATHQYRLDEDVLGAFLDEECVIGEGHEARTATLFSAYRSWCERSGEKTLTKKALGVALQERGFESVRLGHGGSRGWRGLGLLHGDG